MRCKAGIHVLTTSPVVQCWLDEGHMGNHFAHIYYYSVEDIDDHSIKIFDPSRIDKRELMWDNGSNKTETT